MEAEAQHEVVGVVEVVQAIADMEIGLLHDIDLQGEDLVEAFQIKGMGIDEVMANAKIDGEIRHDELSTGGESQCHLLIPGRRIDIGIGADGSRIIGESLAVDLHIGAAVIGAVERDADIQPVVHMIEGIKGKADDTISRGQGIGPLVGLDTLFLPGTVECQIPAPMTLESR